MVFHDDELRVDERLVERLLADQLPGLTSAGLRRLPATGSSNALFRCGDDLLVRLPRQPGGSAGILKEARWLPHLASGLPVATPDVVAVGTPGHGYPEHWSVLRWLDGENPTPASSTGTSTAPHLVADVAAVLLALRELDVPAPAWEDTGLRSYRAGSLLSIDSDVRAYAAQCRLVPGLDLDVDVALSLWTEAVAVAGERRPVPPNGWVHGDLLGENLLVREGRLAAVLDFGGLAVGDPTVDLPGTSLTVVRVSVSARWSAPAITSGCSDEPGRSRSR